MDKDLAVLLGVTLIGIIGVAILSPAFPEIKRGLNLSDFEVAML
ncbi:MAG TPA: MFS transporter, partial [Archaeoglobus profundus]|nr:MFS transporter [Archaeoglobus profundus]